MKSIYKSLAAFQQEVPTIHKGTKGYGYSYADLPHIFETINPLLSKHKLGFTQTVNGTQLCTTIFHIESGETIEGCADIPQGVTLKGMNDFQVLGSAITYMRRYQLSAMLGLVTDKDTDAGGEQVKMKQTMKPQSSKVVVKEDSKEFLAIVDWIINGKENAKGEVVHGNIEKAKQHYSISDEVEASLKLKIQALKEIA
jgi:hypothetical protein